MFSAPALLPARPAFASQARSLLWTLPTRPGLVVVHGHPESSRLAHYFLSVPLLRRETVLFLDAANCFNPHQLAEFARRCRRAPEEFLERVYVSRAFTCFQLDELIARTPAAARRYQARRILLTGLPDIYDDEELKAGEVLAVFRRSLAQLQRWPGRALTALVFSDAVAPRRPLGFRLHRQLTQRATAVYRLQEGPLGLHLQEEKNLPGREVSHGPHHRNFSPADRTNSGALRSLPARSAARRPADF